MSFVFALVGLGCGDNLEPAPGKQVANDTMPPVVTMQVGRYDVFKGWAEIPVSATDDGEVARLELFLDGIKVAEAQNASFTLVWDTVPWSDGIHSLRAVAYDAAGRKGTTETVPILIVNGGETVVFDEAPETQGWLEDTFSVPANWSGSEIDKKYHFTMPEGVTRVMAFLVWDGESGFVFDYSLGTGNCPHSGKVMEDRADDSGEILLYHAPGQAVPQGTWFVHLGALNAADMKGQSAGFSVRVILFR